MRGAAGGGGEGSRVRAHALIFICSRIAIFSTALLKLVITSLFLCCSWPWNSASST